MRFVIRIEPLLFQVVAIGTVQVAQRADGFGKDLEWTGCFFHFSIGYSVMGFSCFILVILLFRNRVGTEPVRYEHAHGGPQLSTEKIPSDTSGSDESVSGVRSDALFLLRSAFQQKEKQGNGAAVTEFVRAPGLSEGNLLFFKACISVVFYGALAFMKCFLSPSLENWG